MLGKKSSQKSAKTRFLNSHEYRTKKWGKKRAKQFLQKHTNSASKKVGEKIVSKSATTRFLYSHEYRDHKMGKKTRDTNFPETHE